MEMCGWRQVRRIPLRNIFLCPPFARSLATTSPNPNTYDAIIVGGGHNGLVSAAYLAKNGLRPLVLERRPVIGGAAVTEEIYPGYRVSRASYLLSLLRPHIISDLDLHRHGLKIHTRHTSSFTPLRDGRYLLLGMNSEENKLEISKFSTKDAEAYDAYEKWLETFAKGIEALLDAPPADLKEIMQGGASSLPKAWKAAKPFYEMSRAMGIKNLPEFYELLTAPASKLLGRWFESEPLMSTLGTDAVIGAWMSPSTPGSSYVLLHHVMGGVNGIKGAWGVVEGGMGAVSESIARAAKEAGADIRTSAPVERILVSEAEGKAVGVRLRNGEEIRAPIVLSNATPKVTFLDLLPENALPHEFLNQVRSISYASGTTKINVALDALPSFSCLPNDPSNPDRPLPHHQGTIHLGCESIADLDAAYKDAQAGYPSKLPLIEMTIPSALDQTLTPEGKHVATMFIQYAPYEWFACPEKGEKRKKEFAKQVFQVVEAYAPGFTQSILAADVLTPPDLERVFGVTGGNIFHGALTLDQLYWARPTVGASGYKTPVKNLFLCGSGAHPGGGVTGSPGRNAALLVLESAV
ncbi:uncharacterized protein SPPG_05219 [Spizellomyces punctatus DAOM BR117]|uniref:Pyridine nucleotide-disulfide oxidoreductase domain-containing protein 2 n=1 Tax=Spizellomyces punctatus (strain DAOM BR117) TaxID=645134 RepID=A0A0L0HEF2_SPIPD|nr:uncharacterized protein SPPG_05219 [Spizellomyces punctatus DAOM BR117]KNC99845.1 hypothetical protein SPPG_05219 [Spizellomyces punctatus DAOM BR117]|eukprot:XP_016607885.1 hypothetical protein SPPG_05219 [Spizellomyces punctatus DAOM BR117]